MSTSITIQSHVLSLTATTLLLAGAAIFGWSRSQPADGHVQVVRERLSMGTTCRLIAVGPRPQVEAALDAAWREIEFVNATMSTYDPGSELSRFNAAAADVDVPLSPNTLQVLRLAQTAATETQGVFDITVRPLAKIWSEAAKQGRDPTSQQLEVAKATSGVDRVVIGATSARKLTTGLELTLDGIAPGYAVQRAIVALKSAGLTGGLVDLGGDIACFGRPADVDAWRIAIQDPWGSGHRGVLHLATDPGRIVAVSTSGDYRRYLEIGGRRYSHILDPRTGRPAAQAASVTVVAADAVTADIWATALSVLGPTEGLGLLEGHNSPAALFITGTKADPNVVVTARFPACKGATWRRRHQPRN